MLNASDATRLTKVSRFLISLGTTIEEAARSGKTAVYFRGSPSSSPDIIKAVEDAGYTVTEVPGSEVPDAGFFDQIFTPSGGFTKISWPDPEPEP